MILLGHVLTLNLCPARSFPILVLLDTLLYLTNLRSHGKDNKLIVWKLSEEDESPMSIVLPVDTPVERRPQPWILYMLPVNTMNFCSFAQTGIQLSPESEAKQQDELLIAVPNTMSSESVSADFFLAPVYSLLQIHLYPQAYLLPSAVSSV